MKYDIESNALEEYVNISPAIIIIAVKESSCLSSGRKTLFFFTGPRRLARFVFSKNIPGINYLILSEAKAISISTIPTIQNLTITLGSATPFSSK